MSGLAAFALGLCATRAIMGRTWAGANVKFEPTTPVVVTTPTICVYAGRGRAEVERGDLLNAAGDARLRFEFFLPASFTTGGFTFETEMGQALVFACLWRQVETVLLTDTTPWATLWRDVQNDALTIESGRDLYEPDKGQKIAVMVVELHCSTLADPPIGEPPAYFWQRFVAAMTAEGGELAALAALMAAQIQGSDAPLADWLVAMGQIGGTPFGMQAIGLATLADETPERSAGETGAPLVEEIDQSATPAPPPP